MFGFDNFGLGLFCIGILGTSVYVFKMLLSLKFNIGHDYTTDIDLKGIDFTAGVDFGDTSRDVDLDIDDYNFDFNQFNINTISAFTMLFGWFGFISYYILHSVNCNTVTTTTICIISILVGIIAGWLGMQLNFQLLNKLATYRYTGVMNKNFMIGQLGTVCIKIDQKNAGAVTIKTDSNNIIMEMIAISNNNVALKVGTPIKVVAVESNKLIVEPVGNIT